LAVISSSWAGQVPVEVRDSLASGVTFLFLGGIFLMHTFRIFTLGHSWPLFIVMAGLSMLLPRNRLQVERRAGLVMKISPRVVVGLLIVAFGLALTLDELGVMNAGELIHYWPFGIVAVGIANVLDQDRSKADAGLDHDRRRRPARRPRTSSTSTSTIWRFWPLPSSCSA
jgi:hypothetical protein